MAEFKAGQWVSVAIITSVGEPAEREPNDNLPQLGWKVGTRTVSLLGKVIRYFPDEEMVAVRVVTADGLPVEIVCSQQLVQKVMVTWER